MANAPAAALYTALGSFENLTPMLKDKVEEWEATPDTCSFKAQGFTMSLMMDREAMEEQSSEVEGRYTIKVIAAESPIPFAMWLQLKAVAPYESRLRVVAEVELNMMYKMMIGSKLQKAVDQLAQQIADGVSGRMPTQPTNI